MACSRERDNGITDQNLEAIKAHLARMCLLFIDLHNRRDWTGMLEADWFHQNFVAASDYQGSQQYVDLETHVAQFKEHVDESPGFLIRPINTQAEMNRRDGTCTVFVNGDHCGNAPGLALPGVAMFNWHRSKDSGEWLLCRVCAIRSSHSSSRSMGCF